MHQKNLFLELGPECLNLDFNKLYWLPSPSALSNLFLGGCYGRRTGVAVTAVSNSLILGGWVTKVLKNGDKK